MSELSNKEKNWGALAHLSLYTVLAVFVIAALSALIYFGGDFYKATTILRGNALLLAIIVSFLLYLIVQLSPPFIVLFKHGHESEFAAHHARESINLVLTAWGCFLLALVVFIIANSFISPNVPEVRETYYKVVYLVYGVSSVAALGYFGFWPLVAASRALRGELYRYPFSFRLF